MDRKAGGQVDMCCILYLCNIFYSLSLSPSLLLPLPLPVSLFPSLSPLFLVLYLSNYLPSSLSPFTGWLVTCCRYYNRERKVTDPIFVVLELSLALNGWTAQDGEGRCQLTVPSHRQLLGPRCRLRRHEETSHLTPAPEG